MRSQVLNVTCDACGSSMSGVFEDNGDFLTVKEMKREFFAVGCPQCGGMCFTPKTDADWEKMEAVTV